MGIAKKLRILCRLITCDWKWLYDYSVQFKCINFFLKNDLANPTGRCDYRRIDLWSYDFVAASYPIASYDGTGDKSVKQVSME